MRFYALSGLFAIGANASTIEPSAPPDEASVEPTYVISEYTGDAEDPPQDVSTIPVDDAPVSPDPVLYSDPSIIPLGEEYISTTIIPQTWSTVVNMSGTFVNMSAPVLVVPMMEVVLVPSEMWVDMMVQMVQSSEPAMGNPDVVDAMQQTVVAAQGMADAIRQVEDAINGLEIAVQGIDDATIDTNWMDDSGDSNAYPVDPMIAH